MTPFNLVLYRPAEKDFKRLYRDNPDLLNAILDEAFPAIKADPYASGNPKKGPLKGVYAYDLKSRNIAYRVCYLIEPRVHNVYVISFGVHDLAYRKAGHRVLSARQWISRKR